MTSYTDFLSGPQAKLIRDYFSSYPVNSLSNRQRLCSAIDSFTPELLEKGINQDALDVLKLKLKGKHPLGGQIQDVRPNWIGYGGGWKIHLHVSPKNQIIVYSWLQSHCPYGWKYLHGGEPGSQEFTVYCGSWDSVVTFSDDLTRTSNEFLESSAGLTMVTDIPLTSKICARYDCLTWDLNHHLFSYKASILGLSPLMQDFRVLKSKFLELGRSRHFGLSDWREIQSYWDRSFLEHRKHFSTYFCGETSSFVDHVKLVVKTLS